jgi:hypothetical protein
LSFSTTKCLLWPISTPEVRIKRGRHSRRLDSGKRGNALRVRVNEKTSAELVNAEIQTVPERAPEPMRTPYAMRSRSIITSLGGLSAR